MIIIIAIDIFIIVIASPSRRVVLLRSKAASRRPCRRRHPRHRHVITVTIFITIVIVVSFLFLSLLLILVVLSLIVVIAYWVPWCGSFSLEMPLLSKGGQAQEQADGGACQCHKFGPEVRGNGPGWRTSGWYNGD